MVAKSVTYLVSKAKKKKDKAKTDSGFKTTRYLVEKFDVM